MSNVVRGGQNLLHYFRMFDQVIKSLMYVVFSTAFVVCAWLLYKNISLYDLKLYSIYLFAKFYVELGIKNGIIVFHNSYGDLQKYKAIDIANNPEAIKLFQRVTVQFVISVLEGLRWGIYLALFTLCAFALKGWQMAKKKTLRGKNLVETSTLKRQISFYNLKKFYFDPIKIVGIPFPKNHEKTHTLITGASGTGKTVVISDVISQVRKKNQKAIIYDRMGVYVARFYDPKKDVLLNPLDLRSANWNLLQECSGESIFDMIAAAFIHSSKSSDSFWEDSSRIIFSETLQYLKEQGKTDNKFLKDVYFGEDQTEFNHIINSSVMLKKILSEDSERTTGSILSVLITYVRCLKYLSCNDSSSQNFSIRDWVADDNQSGCLFISSRADQHQTLKPLISVFLELAVNSMLSLKQNSDRQIWLFLDELPSLHYLPSLDMALSESRQFGGSIVLSLQLMAQLRAIYGRDFAESVSGLCRNRVVFSTPEKETATWCAGSLGEIETEETKENYSYGASLMRDGVTINKIQQIKPLVLPTEIMNLRNLNCYVGFSGFPLTKSKIEYCDYPQISERFVPKEKEELPIMPVAENSVDNDPEKQLTTQKLPTKKTTKKDSEEATTSDSNQDDKIGKYFFN